jgi:hypothetical protein
LTSRIIAGIHPKPFYACQIEAPYQAPPKLTAEEERANIDRPRPRVYAMMGALDTYNSIGEFYTELEESVSCFPSLTTTKPIFLSDNKLQRLY